MNLKSQQKTIQAFSTKNPLIIQLIFFSVSVHFISAEPYSRKFIRTFSQPPRLVFRDFNSLLSNSKTFFSFTYKKFFFPFFNVMFGWKKVSVSPLNVSFYFIFLHFFFWLFLSPALLLLTLFFSLTLRPFRNKKLLTNFRLKQFFPFSWSKKRGRERGQKLMCVFITHSSVHKSSHNSCFLPRNFTRILFTYYPML